MHDLPARLRALREETGAPISKIASALGTTVATVSRWETGKADPGLTKIEGWAAALGLALEVVVRPAPPGHALRKLTEKQAELIAAALDAAPLLSDDDAAALARTLRLSARL